MAATPVAITSRKALGDQVRLAEHSDWNLDALRHLDLTAPAEAAHGVGQAWPLRELLLVQPPQSRNEPAPSPERLVRELYHAQVRPRLGPDLLQASKEVILVFARIRLASSVAMAAVEREMPMWQ